MTYGFQIFNPGGLVKTFDLDHMGYRFIEAISVAAGVSGSKTYTEYAGKTLYAVALPYGNNDYYEHGGHVVSVSGQTVTWNQYTVQGPLPQSSASWIMVFYK